MLFGRMRPAVLASVALISLAACSSPDGARATDSAVSTAGIVARARAVVPMLGRAPIGLSARLPMHARDALHLEAQGLALDVTPLDLEARDAERVATSVVFRDAVLDGDVVVDTVDTGVEELRVLRGPRAPTRSRYRLHGGEARLFGRSVEVLDAAGVPRLRMAPPFARDALGEERALEVALVRDGEGALVELSLHAEGLTYPIVVDPAWSSTGSLASPHYAFGDAALLSSGLVAIAGGSTASAPYRTATVELYSPSTGTWSYAAAMPTARSSHTTTAFGDKLIVAGGDAATSTVSTSVIYDHATNSWSNGPSFSYGRRSHAAVLLADGRVMISGGESLVVSPYSTGSSYAYNPSSNAWEFTGAHVARSRHALVRLADDRVAALGGGVASVEIWNKASSWSGAGSLSSMREHPIAALLPSGRVLVAGGNVSAGAFLSSAEIWDPATGTSTSVAGLSAPRSGAGATRLPDGRILVTGGIAASGSYVAAAEIFDESTHAWTLAGQGGSRWLHGTVRLPSGAVLVAGGYPNNSAQLFQMLTKGADCSGDYECPTGHCIDGVCCDTTCTEQCKACNLTATKGSCSAVTGAPVGSRSDCGAYVCAAGSCATSCTSDAQCAAGLWCKAGACVAKSAVATACGGAHECASGSCADGVCCDTPCTGQCFACNEPGKGGTCTQVGGAPRTGHTPCPAGYVCGVAATCIEAGTGPKTLGSPCTATSECPSGTFCTDGVCCGQAICPGGSACNLTAKGACAELPGVKCTSGLECGSGNCVDGVCCDRPCAGQCESCNVPGALGTCTPVVGAPRGARTACATDAEVCKSRACDGTTRDACAAFVGSGTTCGAPKCDGATLTPVPACDGKGTCTLASPKACAPYACNAKGCASSCVGDSECAPGFACKASSCVPSGATCTADGLGSIDQAGNLQACAPYRCVASGVCGTACGGTSDCAAGATCDVTNHTCFGAFSTADSGGCATSGGASRSPWRGLVGVALALAAAGVARRRSRPTRRAR